MHPTQTGLGVVRLGDSDFVAANPGDDLRGKDVYDPHGQRMGCVEDLYLDRQEREVRFLEVGSGGFLGGPGHRRAGQDREGGRARPVRHQGEAPVRRRAEERRPRLAADLRQR